MNPILEKYIPIANMIADTFGSCCEVVIHDLDIPENSVVYTRNNHVTQRAVGQSFDHLIKNVLLSKDFRNDCTSNYVSIQDNGKKIKSSTAIIRNNNNKAIGALCVNIDITALETAMDYIQDILGSITSTSNNMLPEEVEVIPNIQEIVDELIDKIINHHDLFHMSRDERIDIIRFMYEKGIFHIKGSISKVAEKMNISKVTIYSYLDEVKSQKADT